MLSNRPTSWSVSLKNDKPAGTTNTIGIACYNNSGQGATGTAFFNSVSSVQSSITVVSPNGGAFDNGRVQNIIVGWQRYMGDFDYYAVNIGNTVANVGKRISGSISKESTGFTTTSGVIQDAISGLSGKVAPEQGYYFDVYAIKMDAVGEMSVATGRSGVFTITTPTTSAQPSITVVSPNGGENWQAGSTQIIRWNSSNVSKVSLDLYNPSSGVLTVKNLVNMTGNPGSVSWTIPSYISPGQYWLRVGTCLDPLVNCNTSGSVDPVSMNGVYDGSDSYFTISSSQSSDIVATKEAVANYYRELLKREPEAGGVEYWLNTGMSLEKVKQGIIASYEYGVKKQITDLYRSLLNREPEASSLTYWYGKIYTDRWTIDQVKYGIMTSSEYTNRTTVSTLTVQPSITVTSPTAGTQWVSGTAQQVNWYGSGIQNANLGIFLRDPSNGLACFLGQQAGQAGNVTLYPSIGYQCPNQNQQLNAGQYNIIVTYPYQSYANAGGTYANVPITLIAAATVSVQSYSQPSIIVTSPTFGQTIEGKAGTSFNVQWTTQNWSPDTLTNIDIIYPDGSVVRARSGMFNTDDNHGSATVNINADQTTSKILRARVSAAKSGTLATGETAESGNFTITPPTVVSASNVAQPSITVVSPNSGTWVIGSQQTVTVRTEIIPSNIVPSAYLKNADTGARIEGVAFAALDSTNRTLTVTVPSTVPAGRYYVEALAWYEGQWYSDQSDGVITVTAPTTSSLSTVSQMASVLEAMRVTLERIKAQYR